MGAQQRTEDCESPESGFRRASLLHPEEDIDYWDMDRKHDVAVRLTLLLGFSSMQP